MWVDAGRGQNGGCRLQSSRLMGRRRGRDVVDPHLEARALTEGARIPVCRRSRDRVGRRRCANDDEHTHQHEGCRDCSWHEATVRLARQCLNALEVTCGDMLVTPIACRTDVVG